MDFPNLIFDRTIDDVNFALSLIKKWQNDSITDKERALWFDGLKGSYNYTDLNRVGVALNLLIDKLNSSGYLFDYVAKTDWKLSDVPVAEELRALVGVVGDIRKAFTMFATTPNAPINLKKMTYSTANDIERIIYDAYTLINSAAASYYYAGEIFAGV